MTTAGLQGLLGGFLFNAFGPGAAGSQNQPAPIAAILSWYRTRMQRGTLTPDLVTQLINSAIDAGAPDWLANAIGQGAGEMDQAIANHVIMVPPPRRDGRAPQYMVIDLAQGRAFMTYEYFSRSFIKAVRSRERTAGFRGYGGRRQARTKK